VFHIVLIVIVFVVVVVVFYVGSGAYVVVPFVICI